MVVANASNGSYDDVRPEDVVEVVSLALQRKGGSMHSNNQATNTSSWQLMLTDEDSFLVGGYGGYVHQWPAGW